jgi:hypothetical protein
MTAACTLVDELAGRGMSAKLIGGVACAIHQHDVAHTELHRTLGDIDLAIQSGREREVARVLPELGWAGHDRFNAMHGDERLIFERPDGLKLDVMVGDLHMCQTVPLDRQWAFGGPTVSITTLLLTKLQIHQLTARDATDIISMLLEHDVVDESAPGDDVLDTQQIAELAGSSWEWHRGIAHAFDFLRQRPEGLRSAATADAVGTKIDQIRAAIDRQPKTRRWRLRSRIGDRKAWYFEPEEV